VGGGRHRPALISLLCYEMNDIKKHPESKLDNFSDVKQRNIPVNERLMWYFQFSLDV